MTINELEQGLRNLIATQPIVTTGANGEVISGINSIIDAYRNLAYRIHTYPSQDIMKFGLSNESAKLENTLSNLVLQVMQERGFNLLLYIPRTNVGTYGSSVNQYGMINNGVNPNMMMGQMMYQNNNAMNMGGMYGSTRANMPTFNPLQPQMVGMATNPYGRGGRNMAPTFPGYQRQDRPVQIMPATQNENSIKSRTAPQSKIKTTPNITETNADLSVTEENSKTETNPQPVKEHTPSPAEILIAGATGGAGIAESGSGKAKGRDYLVELLKK